MFGRSPGTNNSKTCFLKEYLGGFREEKFPLSELTLYIFSSQATLVARLVYSELEVI